MFGYSRGHARTCQLHLRIPTGLCAGLNCAFELGVLTGTRSAPPTRDQRGAIVFVSPYLFIIPLRPSSRYGVVAYSFRSFFIAAVLRGDQRRQKSQVQVLRRMGYRERFRRILHRGQDSTTATAFVAGEAVPAGVVDAGVLLFSVCTRMRGKMRPKLRVNSWSYVFPSQGTSTSACSAASHVVVVLFGKLVSCRFSGRNPSGSNSAAPRGNRSTTT